MGLASFNALKSERQGSLQQKFFAQCPAWGENNRFVAGLFTIKEIVQCKFVQ